MKVKLLKNALKKQIKKYKHSMKEWASTLI